MEVLTTAGAMAEWVFMEAAWAGGRFMYNTAAWRVNRTFIHNTYVNNKLLS